MAKATGLRWTEQEFASFKNKDSMKETSIKHVTDNNKFHNVICEADKIKFPSKKHRQHYLLLKALKQAGIIKFFLREVPFDLPGQYDSGRVVRHYVDFVVIYPDMTAKFQEVKGRDLAMGKMKRAQVEDIYGIKIEVI